MLLASSLSDNTNRVSLLKLFLPYFFIAFFKSQPLPKYLSSRSSVECNPTYILPFIRFVVLYIIWYLYSCLLLFLLLLLLCYCSRFFRSLDLTISLYTFLFLGFARYCPIGSFTEFNGFYFGNYVYRSYLL